MPSVHTENRKNRRMKAKLQRSKELNPRKTVADAVKGMIKSMKQSERVQDLVTSGKLDKYLG